MHNIVIRTMDKDRSDIGHGYNTEILVDGKPLEGVAKATLHIGVGEINTLELEMMGRISVDVSAVMKEGEESK